MFSSLARWMQRILFAAGFVLLGYCGADWIHSRMQQSAGSRELDRILNQQPETAARSTIPEGDLVGKVEIPKVHLSAVVFQGTTDRILDKGVGHLDGTALPGENGNVVLAAHRDTFFRSLRNIQKGDEITVTTPAGPREYEVDSTEIVDPTDVAVAGPTSAPTLTLITCYPFYFVGHAPKRFIVKARDMAAENKTARKTSSEEPLPSRLASMKTTPQKQEESADLTYVFRASQ
jgi:sortase A